MAQPTSSLVVEGSEDQPLVLAGPPGALTGRVQLRNPSDVSVVFREAGLKDPTGVLSVRRPPHAVAPVVLRPEQGATVGLTVAVDPSTPPGEYPVELEVGGRPRHGLLQVAEVFALTVRPETIVVVNRSHDPQSHRLIVTNDGNVAFTIGLPDTVELMADVRWRLLTLDRWTTRDIETLVTVVLDAARGDSDERRESERMAALVRNLSGDVPLSPGETTAIELEISLEEALPPRQRYWGRMPVLTKDVDIVIVPGRPRTAPTKSAKRRGGRP